MVVPGSLVLESPEGRDVLMDLVRKGRVGLSEK